MGRFSRFAQGFVAAQPGAPIAKPPLGKLYGTQLLLLLAVVAGLLWIDRIVASSALLGGLISIGPSYFFARQVFRFRGARFAPQIAQAFYVGETGKFLLTAAAFAAAFALVKPLNAAVLLSAYLAMTACHWVCSAWIANIAARTRR
jgi:ATP synthase protein I